MTPAGPPPLDATRGIEPAHCSSGRLISWGLPSACACTLCQSAVRCHIRPELGIPCALPRGYHTIARFTKRQSARRWAAGQAAGVAGWRSRATGGTVSVAAARRRGSRTQQLRRPAAGRRLGRWQCSVRQAVPPQTAVPAAAVGEKPQCAAGLASLHATACALDSGTAGLKAVLSCAAEVQLPPGQQVLRALPAEGPAPALLQLQNGKLVEFRDGALAQLTSSSFPAPCPLMARVPAGAAGGHLVTCGMDGYLAAHCRPSQPCQRSAAKLHSAMPLQEGVCSSLWNQTECQGACMNCRLSGRDMPVRTACRSRCTAGNWAHCSGQAPLGPALHCHCHSRHLLCGACCASCECESASG